MKYTRAVEAVPFPKSQIIVPDSIHSLVEILNSALQKISNGGAARTVGASRAFRVYSDVTAFLPHMIEMLRPLKEKRIPIYARRS
jgi:hypothetical protein